MPLRHILFAMALPALIAILPAAAAEQPDSADELGELSLEQLRERIEEDEDAPGFRHKADQLGELRQAALDRGAYPEAIRAWMSQLQKKYIVQDDDIDQPVYVISQLWPEIDSHPESVRPLLRAILADWLYLYGEDYGPWWARSSIVADSHHRAVCANDRNRTRRLANRRHAGVDRGQVGSARWPAAGL